MGHLQFSKNEPQLKPQECDHMEDGLSQGSNYSATVCAFFPDKLTNNNAM